MRCRTMLLGGAVALALSGAAYAQAQQTSPQATPGTDQINGGTAGTQTTGQAPTSDTTATKSSSHHRHHYRHHAHHHMKTASWGHHHHMASGEHGASTPSERQATENLNQQQLQGGSMQTTAQPAGANMNTQPQGAQPQGTMENQPGNANYTQPQGSQGVQPGNAGYQQPQNTTGEPGPSPMSSPGAAGPAGSQGNPTPPTDQNAQPQQPSNPPGPSN